jgi:hypothetical protein
MHGLYIGFPNRIIAGRSDQAVGQARRAAPVSMTMPEEYCVLCQARSLNRGRDGGREASPSCLE